MKTLFGAWQFFLKGLAKFCGAPGDHWDGLE
jgi:hypothetical protein